MLAAAPIHEGVGVSAAKLAAQRVLASVARGITPISQVMDSPPTITLPGGTSMNGIGGFGTQVNLPDDTSKFTGIGGVWIDSGSGHFVYGMAASIATPTTRQALAGGIATRTSAPTIEFAIHGTGCKYAAYVTEAGVRKRVAAADQTGSPSFFGQWVRFAFSGAADRIIEIYTNRPPSNQFGLRGFDCTSGYSFVAPTFDPVELKVLFVGDSHVAHTGSGNTNPIRLCYPDYLGERLGTKNVWAQGIDGRGYLNPGSLAKYRDSIGVNDLAVSLVGNLDVLVIPASTNDRPELNAAYTDVAVQAEVQAAVAAAMAAQPNALIFVPGDFGRTVSPSTSPAVTPQARYDAIKAGVLAAANGNARVVFIDNSPAGTQFITAGNAATRIGPDGTHLTDAGMSAVGYALGDAIIAACTALAA